MRAYIECAFFAGFLGLKVGFVVYYAEADAEYGAGGEYELVRRDEAEGDADDGERDGQREEDEEGENGEGGWEEG